MIYLISKLISLPTELKDTNETFVALWKAYSSILFDLFAHFKKSIGVISWIVLQHDIKLLLASGNGWIYRSESTKTDVNKVTRYQKQIVCILKIIEIRRKNTICNKVFF